MGKIPLCLSYLLSLCGIVLIGLTAYFALYYLLDSSNPARQEYVGGILMFAYPSLGTWSLAAILALFARKLISKKHLILLCMPSIVLWLGYFAFKVK